MSDKSLGLERLLAFLDTIKPTRQEENFLKSRGWLPLGKNCATGIEGWGKIVDRRAVTVDEPEALAIEGWA